MNVRFAEPCREIPLNLDEWENRIFLNSVDAPPCHECQRDVFLGLFFDGTNNNKFRDTPGFTHSNVARLYEAFIGSPAKQDPPKLASVSPDQPREIFPDQAFKPLGFSADDFPYYRKIYIPGVGTPFAHVGDSGRDSDRSLGLAMALGGESRLCWTLLQVCNQVHAALFKQTLQDSVNFTLPSNKMGIPLSPEAGVQLAENYARQLEAQIKPLENQLAKAVAAYGRNKPAIRRIRLSVFGFSRGAAAARAFVNRVNRLWGSSLAGIPLSIDFLGIFDTVASVGLAQSIPGADGHFGWATGGNLMIPTQVKRCVHLVAAHEVRASFPLDSVCRAGCLPGNCKEIVYPGVHSDVGGGYPPGDQGRALGEGAEGDALKLSQIPLLQMYREARMAGVPIGAPNQLIARQLRDFAISPALRTDFNAYIEATRSGRIPATNGQGDESFARMFPTEQQPRHSLEALVTTHYGYFLQWRKSILGHAHELPGMTRNGNASRWQDIEDIRGADEELAKEVRFLEDRNPAKFDEADDPALEAAKKAVVLVPAAARLLLPAPLAVATDITGAQVAEVVRKAIKDAMREKQSQWEGTLKGDWNGESPLKGKALNNVKKLFENYLHDSRAWFKALVSKTSYDNATRSIRLLKSLLGVDGYELAPNDEDWFTLGDLKKETDRQRRILSERLKTKTTRNDWLGKEQTQKELDDLDKYGARIRGGREPYRMYGYLRFRKIYQSGELSATAQNKRQRVIEQDEKARRKQERLDEENARHADRKGRILTGDDRVIRENRLNSQEQDEYFYSSRTSMAAENNRHADEIKAIEQSP